VDFLRSEVMHVAIVDYGMGNLGSLEAMAHRLDLEPLLWRQGPLPKGADWVIFPGVGSLLNATHELSQRGLTAPLEQAKQDGVPILGICLGLQLLFESGDEGGRGLGWFEGTVPRLQAARTPHMGWNTVRSTRPNPLLDSNSNPADPAYYFVHSYVVRPRHADLTLGETTYANETFTSVVKDRAVVGVQFHPELSGSAGRRFIQSFIRQVVA